MGSLIIFYKKLEIISRKATSSGYAKKKIRQKNLTIDLSKSYIIKSRKRAKL